jgi:hypothetical protein
LDLVSGGGYVRHTPYNNTSAASARFARSGVHGAWHTTASGYAHGSATRFHLAGLVGPFRYQEGARRRTFAALRGSARPPCGFTMAPRRHSLNVMRQRHTAARKPARAMHWTGEL